MTPLRGLAPLERRLCTLEELVQRAWPEADPAQIGPLIRQGRVQVNERPRRDPGYIVGPGSAVTLEADLSHDRYGLPDAASELARGQGFILVDKPIGMPGVLNRQDPMNPVLFLADLCGLERDTFCPVWPMPTLAGGPWLCAMTDEDAQRLRLALYAQPLAMTWVAITPRVAIPTGQLQGPHGLIYEYSATRMTASLSELQLMVNPSRAQLPPDHDPVEALLETLAQAGYPALGDRQRGGYLVRGGLRLRLAVLHDEALGLAHSWTPGRGWWLDEVIAPPSPQAAPLETGAGPMAPATTREAPPRVTRGQALAEDLRQGMDVEDDGPARSRAIRPFEVSTKTLEVLAQGHPWALDDAQTQRRDDLAPGTLVQLRDAKGKLGPYALIEGPGPIAARVWCQERDEAEALRELTDLRVHEAILRRADLIEHSHRTSLFRLIHGEADGLPGFYLDRIGPILRATITSHAARAFKARVYANLIDYDPELTILEIAHLEDVRQRQRHQPDDALPRARVAYTKHDFWRAQERMIGLEDHLRFWCEPWTGIDTGFFADQRDNRARLRAMAQPGQRWLNLFGHTGAFSVALASRGAQVVNVDLSKHYLEWTAQSFALNELDPALHQGAAMDARDYLAAHPERVHGIILDPPTAAQSKSGFWSIRKDYDQLLEDCFARLEPGGVMLICRNDRKRSQPLRELALRAAEAASFRVAQLHEAPPSPDYPNLAHFPEGDSFEGLLIQGEP